ncbi:protein DpdE [Solimonas sp. SE-A11]|uniref:protein DpdE n=1 Tax=Solimonas sp. SE-A11 TaxID=3054954 RepID=UPI00259CB21D|nr:protein DpdE [Solimonas sp. SE-A11]MDM4769069.1 protein DpdE [Solimonas sp. SE-A11]
MTNTTEVEGLLGSFVRVKNSPYQEDGIGKLIRLEPGYGVVAYFDVPDEVEPTEIRVPLTVIKEVALPQQTRVFWLDGPSGHWQVGRVLEGEGSQVLVQFPNGRHANVPRTELQVRWGHPISDPVAFLARRVVETPLFAEARSLFMQAVIGQRAASLGMGAVLSSNIQLADYQFNVIRRVLQDPVQRYLLADEVGLGKTIEAGVLIRQYMLDQPRTARILIIVPVPLVAQWRQELADRFNLAAWLDDYLLVVGSDDLDLVEKYLPTTGLLVVDEAHHLSRLGADGRNDLYDRLRAHAPKVPRLLLLSATPVLSDTPGFLRVLHLLDPVVFPLDDLSGFERRLQSRQVVAEIAAALVPENLLSMEDELDRLQGAFQDDNTLHNLIDALRPIVQRLPEEDDESFIESLAALRSYLTETYKLHRRILRNRRKSVPWATPRRSGLDIVEYDCTLTGERHRVLNDLRVHLINLDAPPSLLQALFRMAVQTTVSHDMPGLLQEHGINDVDALAIARRLDAIVRKVRADAARVSVLVRTVTRLLKAPGQQVVVFCDQEVDADLVATELIKALPGDVVQRHKVVSRDEADLNEEAWRAFLRNPSRCRVLVCDFRAEEGLNLHGGRKIALHYDMPPAPNRIEQRLGRLDRFGAGDAIGSVAFACRDDQDEMYWLKCLDEGLGVFKESIASLQYLLEETLRAAKSAWAGEGTEALRRWRDQLAGQDGWVVRERRRIDQQDALDALSEMQGGAFEELEAADDDWKSWREAFDGFAVKALQFQKRQEPWADALPQGEQVFRLAYRREGKSQTLVTLSSFVTEFLGTIDRDAPESSWRTPTTFPYSFRRNTALTRTGTARNVRPLRFGDALVESLMAFCESDDRGRAFAMWRHLPGYEAGDACGADLYFRFDFLVEADISAAGRHMEDEACLALRRRVDGHFPPRFHSVWVTTDGQCSTEAPEVMRSPYNKAAPKPGEGRDYNLNAERWAMLGRQSRIPWILDWSKHCDEARAKALNFLARLGEVESRIEQGVKGLRAQHNARVAQLSARAARLTDGLRDAELVELEAENALNQKLLAAVRAPSFRLDVAGASFVSPETPFIIRT